MEGSWEPLVDVSNNTRIQFIVIEVPVADAKLCVCPMCQIHWPRADIYHEVQPSLPLTGFQPPPSLPVAVEEEADSVEGSWSTIARKRSRLQQQQQLQFPLDENKILKHNRYYFDDASEDDDDLWFVVPSPEPPTMFESLAFDFPGACEGLDDVAHQCEVVETISSPISPAVAPISPDVNAFGWRSQEQHLPSIFTTLPQPPGFSFASC